MRLSRPTATLAIIAASSLTLVACGGGEKAPAPAVTVTSTATAAPAETTSEQPKVDLGAARAAYEKLLTSAPVPNVPSETRYEPTGTTSYAIAEITGDDIPELLFKTDSKEFAPIRIATSDGQGSATLTNDMLFDGAASAGGSRINVYASASRDHVYQLDHMSVSKEGSSTAYTLQGNKIVAGEKATVDKTNLPADYLDLMWFGSSDPTGLDMIPDIAAGATPALRATDSAAPEETTTRKAGTALTGTIVSMTGSELMDGKPLPDPGDPNQSYWILQLDAPTAVTTMKAGKMKTSSETRVYLESGDWSQYEGQHVTVTIPEGSGMFPSGTDMPLGLLRVSQVSDVTVG